MQEAHHNKPVFYTSSWLVAKLHLLTLHPFHCVSSVVSLHHPHPSHILIGHPYTLVSSTCLYFSVYHMFDSNRSLCAIFPERCMLSSYCSSDFPQKDLLLISPRTLCVVLCITMDYVLSLLLPHHSDEQALPPLPHHDNKQSSHTPSGHPTT